MGDCFSCCGWGGWGDDEKGDEEYIRLLSTSDGFELARLGDLGTLMAGVAVNGFGVLCEIVRTGVSEDWSDLTLLSFLLSLEELFEVVFVAAAAVLLFESAPPAAAWAVGVVGVVEATLLLSSG